jgi:hypothetical protein
MNRGDDMIASLMQTMGKQQGYYDKEEEEEDDGDDGDDDQRQQLQRRQLPELVEYPIEKPSLYLAGNSSVWNPLVPGIQNDGATTTAAAAVLLHGMLPTNPQVEIIRRRVFEKFRQDVQIMIQDVFQKQQQDLRLPIPSLIEKWHMDAKLKERSNILNQTTKQKDNGNTNKGFPFRTTTTVEIYQERMKLIRQRMPLYDPVLPAKEASALFIDTLRPEVQKAWQKQQQKQSTNNNPHLLPPKFPKKAQRIQKGLHRLICEALDSFDKHLGQEAYRQQQHQQQSRRHSNIPKIACPHNQDGHDDTSMVVVKFSGVVLKLHAAHYEKLQRLYDRSMIKRRQQQQQREEEYPSFEDAIFCLLCRYDTIQGAGLQAGVPGKIMDTLLKNFHCRMECFASPLNCRYDTFASAFPDVDTPFGSIGSFFEWDILTDDDDGGGGNDDEGLCLQANPPFCDGLILQLNQAIDSVLSKTSNRPVTFVVFVPAWRDSACYQSLLTNKFMTYHLLLNQGEHWYAEGTRYRRKGSFRVASFDTSILFYQNDAAKMKWPLPTTSDGDDHDCKILNDLKDAFCQDPSTEQREAIDKPQKLLLQSTKSTMKKVTNKQENDEGVQSNDEQPDTTAKIQTISNKRKGNNNNNNNNNDSKTEKDKTEKKRRRNKWTEQDEDKAQLNLLQSLGLTFSNAASTGSNSNSNKSQNVDTKSSIVEFSSGSGKSKKKKNKKKTS